MTNPTKKVKSSKTVNFVSTCILVGLFTALGCQVYNRHNRQQSMIRCGEVNSAATCDFIINGNEPEASGTQIVILEV